MGPREAGAEKEAVLHSMEQHLGGMLICRSVFVCVQLYAPYMYVP
jgi:hypothetical protein